MRTCLQNVLDLNPGSEKAQQGLAWVDSRYGPPAAKAEPPADPTVSSINSATSRSPNSSLHSCSNPSATRR